jgi:C1A family cysteine protease
MICTKRRLFSACIVSVAVALALLIVPEFARADKEELEGIRHEIKAKGARWHADETSVSVLSAREKKMRLGLKEDEDLAAIVGETSELAPIATVEGAALILDWRNVEGISYVSPIKNQGACGSCWAFAVTAALESQAMMGTSGTQVDLSEQILVSCSGAGSCSGGYSTTASNYIRDVGLPLESCFKYTATNNSCSNACSNWQAYTYKVIGWHRATTMPYPERVQDIKNALYTYGPVVASFFVYNDFFYYRSGVYSYTSGSYAGAHAVLIVGYDDTNQAFIVKNSWGTGWGEAGYFMIAYSEVGGTSNFAYSTVAYDGFGDTPPPEPPTCTYMLSPTGSAFNATGGTGSFTVSTQSGCSWSASKVDDWVTINSGSSGEASGQITYSVIQNTGPVRTATITVQGQQYTITQQAQPEPPTCTYTLSPTGMSFNATGGTGSFTVSSPSGCSWSANSSASWVRIASASMGTGSGTLTYTVNRNTGVARTATISVQGQQYKITQLDKRAK